MTIHSTARAWFANDMSMTAAGCPSAAARFTRRPSASRMQATAVAHRVLVDELADPPHAAAESSASAPLSISTSKWPAFAMTAPSFMTSKCSRRITLVSPVTVTNTSPIRAASRSGMTRKPSIDGLERRQRRRPR